MHQHSTLYNDMLVAEGLTNISLQFFIASRGCEWIVINNYISLKYILKKLLSFYKININKKYSVNVGSTDSSLQDTHKSSFSVLSNRIFAIWESSRRISVIRTSDTPENAIISCAWITFIHHYLLLGWTHTIVRFLSKDKKSARSSQTILNWSI